MVEPLMKTVCLMVDNGSIASSSLGICQSILNKYFTPFFRLFLDKTFWLITPPVNSLAIRHRLKCVFYAKISILNALTKIINRRWNLARCHSCKKQTI